MSIRYRFAVVGGGAAGITAAHVLSRAHDVTLFEREASLGGHVRTVVVPEGPDAGIALDVGFMVLNDRNYQTVHRLLDALAIDGIGNSDISSSYFSRRHGIQYAINSGAPVVSGGREAAFGELLGEAMRFWRIAGRDRAEGALAGKTLAEYIDSRGFSRGLVDHYLAPFGALAWVALGDAMLEFPAEMFIGFFERHGLLSLAGGPQWQYIRGGSRRYVDAFERCFRGRIERSVHNLVVRRDATGVEIDAANRPAERFDFAVLATHADEALAALADPSAEEKQLLGSFDYRASRAVLHTDSAVMPPDRALWSGWNVARDDDGIAATFYLNRLLGHDRAVRQYFVTVNRATPIADEHVLGEFDFMHPQFTVAAYRAQSCLRKLNGCRRTWFCGTYHGYTSLHEEAVRSGAAVGEEFGLTL